MLNTADPDLSPIAALAAEAMALMDIAVETIRSREPEAGVLQLSADLWALRSRAGADWAPLLVPLIRSHPATALLRQCPLTHHASTWPRGYPGDAGLLDIIYRHHPIPIESYAPEVLRIMATVQAATPCRSVRVRRMLLADAIDGIACEFPGARIFSLACGHLREAEWSLALAAGTVGTLVAADQDEASLRTVEHDYGGRFAAVAPTPLSVRDVLGGRAEPLGPFHLVYAAGLYDYLPEPVAQRLTQRLFALLNPGGRLLIGNFGTGMVESAYMESIMEWPLLWRTASEIAAFADTLPKDEVASSRVWPDATEGCWYLDLRRSATPASAP
jgi:extracellular factor (EF) 3-hydroxypalmitic acid methyl ester biosynthesis protein